MNKELWGQGCWLLLFTSGKHRRRSGVAAFTLLLGCLALSASFFHVSAQRVSPLDSDPNNYYCPAYFHSCETSGTDGYFAPDPFDVAEGCDNVFLQYVFDSDICGPRDRDCNGIDDNSCYGKCDLNYNLHGIDDETCYANCQAGADGQSGYVGCLRNAFGITRQSLRTESPRHLANFAGNVYRSCIAGHPPQLYIDEYNSCIAGGDTVENCCNLVASHFP